MPALTEVLQAPGSFSVPFRRNPDLEALLKYFQHVQVWWENRLVAQGPLHTFDPQTGLYVAKGSGMAWWPGVDNESTPDIQTLLRYCAANNKLSNHDFANGDLYWSRAEGSGWNIAGGVATSGNYEREDVLSHQDSHEVFPGDPMLFGVTATKDGPAAYLRARAVLSGRFTHPNLIQNPGFESGATGWTVDTDTSIVTDANARTGTKVLKLGPLPRTNLLADPSFELDDASWTLDSEVDIVTTAKARTGSKALKLGPVIKPNVIADPTDTDNWDLSDLPAYTLLDWTSTKFGGMTKKHQFLDDRSFESGLAFWDEGTTGNVSTETDGGAHGTTDYVRFIDGGTDIPYVKQTLSGMVSGDEINVTGFARCPEGCIDSGGDDVALVFAFRYTEEDDDFTPTAHNNHTNVLLPRDAIGATWQKQSARFNVPDFTEGSGIDFRVFCPDIISAGYWDLDHFKLTRTRGNVEAIAQTGQSLGNYFPVEPETRYSGRVVIESSNVRRHGSWSMEVITQNLDGSDRDVHKVAELTVSEKADTNSIHRLDFDFTPEEGQDRARIKMLWEDVYVGEIWVRMDKLKVHVANGHRRFARQADVPVTPESPHRFAVWGKVDDTLKEGKVWLRVVYQGVDPCDAVQESSSHDFRRTDVDVCADAPDYLFVDFTPPEGVTMVDAEIWMEDAKGGSFYIDDAELYQTSGVRRKVAQTGIPLIPERSYPLSLYVKPDSSVTKGKVWPRAILKAADQIDFEQGDDVVVDGSPVEVREDADATGLWNRIDFTVSPETGYDSCDIHIMCEDVEGGSFWVDDLDMHDGDKSSLVIEKRIGTSGTHTQTFTVPEGAESGGFQLAVDGPVGAGWTVDDAVFRRNCTPVTAVQVVREAISGTGLSEGTLYSAGNIGFDLVFRNQTRRQIIDEVSRAGVVQPPREWRANPDGTFDWGLPEELFTDRNTTNGLVIFQEGDSWLVEDPDVEHSKERYPTQVRVLGAERRSVNGDPYTVTGNATNPVNGLKKFDGTDFAREHLIEDGGVDHSEYADALARDEADTLAEERESYQIGVADWRTLGDFEVGDWLYLYHPTEGLEDSDNPMSVDGRTIYPKRLRVIERDWTMGSGPFRVVLRRGPGDEIDVSEYVDWPATTTASLTLGNPRPEYLSNPQGGASGQQFLKYRRAVPSR